MEQEIEKKQRRRKKRAAPNTRVVFVLVGAVLLIYLGVMVIGAFSDTPETTAYPCDGQRQFYRGRLVLPG